MMKELGFVDVSDNKRLILKIGDYQGGPEKIDLRIYVKKDDNELIATKSGMSFSSEWLSPFLQLINKLDSV